MVKEKQHNEKRIDEKGWEIFRRGLIKQAKQQYRSK